EPELVPLIDFAARELGQTRSSFFYIAGRDKLRALGVLPAPAIPPMPMSNGNGATPDIAPQVKPAAPPAYGQEQTRRFNNFLANGWVVVEPGVMPGVSVTEIEGMQLCVRPQVISEKARKAEQAEAEACWISVRQNFTEGVPLASGAGRHPSAISSNRLNKTIERITVPKD